MIIGLRELKKIADAEFVAFQAKTRNHTDTGFGNDAFVTEFFPLVNIGDMNFERGSRHTGNRIRNRDRSMGIASGIEQNRIEYETDLVDLIDEFPLHIALIIMKLQLWKSCHQRFEIVFERSAAIDFWLSFSQKIQIGAVDYLDFQKTG